MIKIKKQIENIEEKFKIDKDYDEDFQDYMLDYPNIFLDTLRDVLLEKEL